MLLCALYYVHEKQMPGITFVTSSKLLCSQLKREIGELYQEGFNKYFDFGTPEDPTSIKGNKLMIVDEADMSLSKVITLDVASGKLNGLCLLKDATKVIYLSATMPKYFRNLISECFGPFDLTVFKSQYEICTKAQSPHSIIAENFNDMDKLVERVVHDLHKIGELEQGKKTPVIFYIER